MNIVKISAFSFALIGSAFSMDDFERGVFDDAHGQAQKTCRVANPNDRYGSPVVVRRTEGAIALEILTQNSQVFGKKLLEGFDPEKWDSEHAAVVAKVAAGQGPLVGGALPFDSPVRAQLTEGGIADAILKKPERPLKKKRV